MKEGPWQSSASFNDNVKSCVTFANLRSTLSTLLAISTVHLQTEKIPGTGTDA